MANRPLAYLRYFPIVTTHIRAQTATESYTLFPRDVECGHRLMRVVCTFQLLSLDAKRKPIVQQPPNNQYNFFQKTLKTSNHSLKIFLATQVRNLRQL